MQKHNINIMGDPALTEKAIPVEQFDESLVLLVQELKNTMKNNAGVGFSAPQIDQNKRVIVFGFDKNERYPTEGPVPFTVLINPEYQAVSKKLISAWEGCLSVPGMRGIVPRFEKIRYRGYDVSGALVERVVDGFHARIVQHEIDHLDGILFPFRIEDLKNFGFERVLFNKIYR
jgi:peptide deformylase